MIYSLNETPLAQIKGKKWTLVKRFKFA